MRSGSDLRSVHLYEWALQESAARGDLLVEQLDGTVRPTSLRWWLRDDDVPAPEDFDLLSEIDDGPVLDVGCATGRHLERLGARGIRATGIDTLGSAVEMARSHGFDAHTANVWTYRPARRYRWVLLLGNNIGIAGKLSRLPLFLRRCRELLDPGGRIMLSSMDPPSTDGPGYPGDLHLRHRYASLHGPWFPWLYLDPVTLAASAAREGFDCTVLYRHDGFYVSRLDARPERGGGGR